MTIVPRFLVQRTFREGWLVPPSREGAQRCRQIVADNASFGVTWTHSYVSEDRSVSYCICDAPSPAAVRRAAAATGLPVDRVTEVRVLDPYFHH